MFELIIHLVKLFFLVVLGVIYLPLNMLLMKISEKSQHLKYDDPVDYWLIKIAVFPIWLICAIFSAPYEMLLASAH